MQCKENVELHKSRFLLCTKLIRKIRFIKTWMENIWLYGRWQFSYQHIQLLNEWTDLIQKVWLSLLYGSFICRLLKYFFHIKVSSSTIQNVSSPPSPPCLWHTPSLFFVLALLLKQRKMIHP